LNNKTKEAQENLNLAAREIDKDNYELVDICLVATQGLTLFRMGEAEEGAKYYEIAIESSRRSREDDMLESAILNYTRELLLYSNSAENREKVVNLLAEVPEKPKDSANGVMRGEVEKLLKECDGPKIEGIEKK